MKTIFLDCNDQLAPVWARVIRPDDPVIDVNRAAFARDDLPRIIHGYDIAIDDHSYMPTPLVAQCPELKHIVFLGTGPASYMNVGEMEARGIKVHIIKGYGDTAVAEHSIALMVAAARDVARMDREVRAGVWTPHEGVQLTGKTLGVIGLGGIGREVARIGKGMGMEVIGWNRTRHADIAVPLVDIDTLLAQARRGVDESHARRRDARLSLGRAHRAHETGRHLRQHRARRAGRTRPRSSPRSRAAISATPGSTCSTPSR